MISAGFDVGTRFVKIAVVRDGRVVGYDVRELRGSLAGVLKASYKTALGMAGLFGFEVKAKAATGFGSNLVKGAHFTIDPESCAAKAVTTVAPEVRTVIDAGGLFINICTVNERGVVLERVENEKCAAGSCKFLELVATSLEVPVENISRVAASSHSPYRISDSCAVFAESEVISRVNNGAAPADVLAGIIRSMAEKAHTMYSKAEAEAPIAVVGGLARFPYFISSVEQALKIPVTPVSLDVRLAGAYGAALYAAERALR